MKLCSYWIKFILLRSYSSKGYTGNWVLYRDVKDADEEICKGYNKLFSVYTSSGKQTWWYFFKYEHEALDIVVFKILIVSEKY